MCKYKNEYAKIMRLPESLVGEVHHIVPRSVAKLRGWNKSRTNQKGNLRKLSYKNHYRAHVLLCYFLEGQEKDKMIYAWHGMSTRQGKEFVTEDEFSVLKAELSRVCSERMSGSGNTMFGKSHSQETKDKISKAKQNPSQETRDKLSKAAQNRSQETKDKMSKAKQNQTQETKDKNSKAQQGKVTCRDLRTGGTKRVTKQEFDSYDYLVGASSKKPNFL